MYHNSNFTTFRSCRSHDITWPPLTSSMLSLSIVTVRLKRILRISEHSSTSWSLIDLFSSATLRNVRSSTSMRYVNPWRSLRNFGLQGQVNDSCNMWRNGVVVQCWLTRSSQGHYVVDKRLLIYGVWIQNWLKICTVLFNSIFRAAKLHQEIYISSSFLTWHWVAALPLKTVH